MIHGRHNMFFNLINVNSPTNFSGIDNGNQSAQNLADLNLTQRSEEPTQIQNTSAPEVKTESASLGVIDLEFKYPNYEVLDKKIVDDAILADFPYSGDIDKLKTVQIIGNYPINLATWWAMVCRKNSK